ncbi:hypothetical protein NT6N_21420 [Oceaniferula spumae]|uniref:Ice-binding protein C-terminal domain-containing protein n=1 Tax=Oceaniferula spumae TaxID=2979115 RepID=A0AAT9FLV4_9BACT
MKLTIKAQVLAALAVCSMSANAAITYIDAAAGSNIEWLDAGTWNSDNTAFTSFNGGSASANDNKWDLRTSGPGANASGNTAYSAGHTENGPSLRMIVSGLDAGTTYQFYLYSIRAGNSDIIQATISNDVSATAAVPSLTTYQNGTDVLQNGDLGTEPSGDRRSRMTLAQVSGSTSYAVYIDDFNGDPGPGDRVTLDGIGFEAVPEPSSAALLGLGGLALILRRRK